MQSEYDISSLYQEAQTRWLKPPEVHFILHNHERYELTHQAPQNPTSGSMFLFNRRVLKFFRKDGHRWRRKKDGRAIAEAHERLKVGNVEALSCYYAHGEHDPSFQRRIYSMLDPGYDHIVLVHYRDTSVGKEGRQTSGTVLQSLQNDSGPFSSLSSIGAQNDSTFLSLSPTETQNDSTFLSLSPTETQNDSTLLSLSSIGTRNDLTLFSSLSPTETQNDSTLLSLSPTETQNDSTLFSSLSSIRTQNANYSHYIGDSTDIHQQHSSTSPSIVSNTCFRLDSKNSLNLFKILALLNHPQPLDAEIEGIWGMAGIGKTSIAREIFEELAPQYDLCYFLQDFHCMCKSKGLRQIRDDFLSKVFREEKLCICASDTKPSFMRDWFKNRAILVVLDDVSNARDAEYVVGGFSWFSRGHRIILTSRSKQVLVQCKVKEPHEMQLLCEFESLRLCKQYLKEESAIMSELISCSSGIPLALKVLASSVSKQHMNDMKKYLQSLRENPPTKIQEAFRRSFDGLDENGKNIFLDLACFFRGENKDHVVQLLDACGFYTYLGICDLTDESLISLVGNKIEIPIPFQDVGRFIVHEEDMDPFERSRLWDSNDIINVLTNNSGTEAIEGIFLDASDLTCEFSPTVFSKMYRLRLLKFYCSNTSGNQCKLSLPQGLDTLPDELRLLHWEHYPLEYLPEKFIPENLVEINMPYSNMEKLCEGKKNLEKLKKIRLSHSRKLTDVVMLSEAMNLEHIDLEGCTSLTDVSTSITHLGKLVSLNMKDCCHLRSLPSMVDLTSLKLLNLSGCSELEDIHDFSPNLEELYLAGTAIRELPFSVENLTELSTLDLENCVRLQKLPSGVTNSRVKLKLSGCTSLVRTSLERTSLALRKRKR